MLRFLIMALVLSWSVGLSASTIVPSDRSIDKIIYFKNAVGVYYTPPFTTSEHCESEAVYPGVAVIIIADDPDKILISAVMSAHASGKKVGFGLSGCTG
jgi:hypothetical protein